MLQLFFILNISSSQLVNEIYLNILGGQNTRILGNEFASLPDKITINETELVQPIEKFSDLSIGTNNITLKWNNSFTNFSHMFHDMFNLIEVNFSKFIASNIVNMDYFCILSPF